MKNFIFKTFSVEISKVFRMKNDVSQYGSLDFSFILHQNCNKNEKKSRKNLKSN